ncbi:MAG TPA: DUF4114 domain-containing protein [Chryseosolibacter sp.]|nr:DUF4114 domain-containing protein [Chryseosolibacter sp.]
MKSSVVLSVLLLIASFGCEEKEKVIEVVDEVPKDVFHIDLCETLNATVMSMLAESDNNREKYPDLFANSVPTEIVLTKEADVYVSFITESASLPSTLAFYTYSGSAPSTSGDVDKKIAFPHVSNAVLNSGDSRKIGRFPAGTRIGFFLVIGAYHDNTVNWEKPSLWTNSAWNDGGTRQHLIFNETQCNNIVMAFEDKNVTSTSDNDYNDVVFLISDNSSAHASSSFELNSVPSM